MNAKRLIASAIALAVTITSVPITTFAETRVVQPTCTEGGYTESDDTGEIVRYDETEPLNHEAGEWEVVETSSYQRDGGTGTITSYQKKCIRCPEILDTKTEDVFTLPATCEEAGYTETKVNNEVVSNEDLQALEHDFGKWSISIGPKMISETETSREWQTTYKRTCKRCRKVEEKIEHEYVTFETCENDGKIVHEYDGYPEENYEEILPAKGHEWRYSNSDIQDSTTEDGAYMQTSIDYQKCTVCGLERMYEKRIYKRKDPTCTKDGYVYTESMLEPENNGYSKIPAKGHYFGSPKTIKYPTISETGIEEYTCSHCGAKKTETISKIKPDLRFSEVNIYVGKTKKIYPAFISDGDTIVSCKPSNKKMAKVTLLKNNCIKIEAKKMGYVGIEVTTKYGAKAGLPVLVFEKGKALNLDETNPPKSIKATVNGKKKVTLKKGKTAKIVVVKKPLDSFGKITYKSSNKKIATVSKKGKIKAKKKGKCTITVKCGNKKKKIKVTVK